MPNNKRLGRRRFPSPCGEIKGQNPLVKSLAHSTPSSGFRPLAGKLRAKTPRGQFAAAIPVQFPSPCGEIKGQNRYSLSQEGTDHMFPSPCGEIKGQNKRSFSSWSGTTCGFRPLAGKLRAKTANGEVLAATEHNSFPSPCGEIKGQNQCIASTTRRSARSFRPLAGKLRAKTLTQLIGEQVVPRFPSPCGEIKGQN